jgi:hypothetical protein
MSAKGSKLLHVHLANLHTHSNKESDAVCESSSYSCCETFRCSSTSRWRLQYILVMPEVVIYSSISAVTVASRCANSSNTRLLWPWNKSTLLISFSELAMFC